MFSAKRTQPCQNGGRSGGSSRREGVERSHEPRRWHEIRANEAIEPAARSGIRANEAIEPPTRRTGHEARFPLIAPTAAGRGPTSLSGPSAAGEGRVLLRLGGPGIGEEEALAGAALGAGADVGARAARVHPGLERGQVEGLEQVLPAADAGVLGLDGGAD